MSKNGGFQKSKVHFFVKKFSQNRVSVDLEGERGVENR